VPVAGYTPYPMPSMALGRTTRMDWAGHLDAGREAAASRTAERAVAALLTLASAQFLMTLHSSVMNVSIVTVAETSVRR